jgi:acyl carrier protein
MSEKKSIVFDELKPMVKSIMDLDLDELDLDRNLAEIDEWDSFNNLMLISEVEKKFDVKYSAQELADILTVNQIIDSISSKI